MVRAFRPFGVNPFRAPNPLPILNPSNFVPKRVSSGKGVKEGYGGLMRVKEVPSRPSENIITKKLYLCRNTRRRKTKKVSSF